MTRISWYLWLGAPRPNAEQRPVAPVKGGFQDYFHASCSCCSPGNDANLNGIPGLNLHCSAANRRDWRIGLSCKEFRLRNASAQPDEPVVRVIFNADRVRAETIVHERVCLIVGLEGVDLELHLVAVGIREIHRHRYAVVDAPIRLDPIRSEPRIVLEQVAQLCVGIGDMVDTDDAQLIGLAALGLQQCHVGKGEPVVLTVIGQKRQRRVLVLSPGIEYGLIPR
jgi:hypothetical protein